MKFQLLAIAIFAGILNPFLGGTNTTLSKRINQPYWAVVFTFAIAMTASLAAALVSRQPAMASNDPSFSELSTSL